MSNDPAVKRAALIQMIFANYLSALAKSDVQTSFVIDADKADVMLEIVNHNVILDVSLSHSQISVAFDHIPIIQTMCEGLKQTMEQDFPHVPLENGILVDDLYL